MSRSASYLERGAEILSIGSCAAAGIDEERQDAGLPLGRGMTQPTCII